MSISDSSPRLCCGQHAAATDGSRPRIAVVANTGSLSTGSAVMDPLPLLASTGPLTASNAQSNFDALLTPHRDEPSFDFRLFRARTALHELFRRRFA